MLPVRQRLNAGAFRLWLGSSGLHSKIRLCREKGPSISLPKPAILDLFLIPIAYGKAVDQPVDLEMLSFFHRKAHRVFIKSFFPGTRANDMAVHRNRLPTQLRGKLQDELVVGRHF